MTSRGWKKETFSAKVDDFFQFLLINKRFSTRFIETGPLLSPYYSINEVVHRDVKNRGTLLSKSLKAT